VDYPPHLEDRTVSVVIATRDRPRLLRRAIDSVIAQRHDHHVEIVVVFDRSEPDHSLEREFGPADGNLRVVVTGNGRSPGLAGARNSGIDKASNTWIALCDDDDEWLPGKLQAQFEALAATPEARAACTGILVHYEGIDTARMPDQALLTFDGFLRDRMTEVHPSSWLVHKDTLLDEIGLVDEDIPGSYAEDYDLFLRTARVCPIAVAPQPLIRVWWHGASFFFERWKMIDRALEYLIDKYPEFERQPEGLARIRGQQAVAQAAMGRRMRAVRTMARVARLNPLEKRLPLAAAVAVGLPAESALKAAHKFGKGI
jgi:glycosyltransferase involved in cell wall biosynthesis